MSSAVVMANSVRIMINSVKEDLMLFVNMLTKYYLSFLKLIFCLDF